MSEASLAVELRTETGKGVARRLRRDGRIPGIVYGSEMAATSISLDPVALDHLIRTSHAGVNTLIDLTGGGDVAGKTVLVKELQREPVRGALIHADLFEVDQDVRITVQVPVHLTGIPEGVTMGGLMDHALRQIELDCLPSAIPDELTVDVSALDIGDSIHVSDLALPSGVELVTSDELSVVSVVAPKAEEEPTVDEELLEGAEAEGEDGETPAAGDDAGADGGGEGESKDS